MMHKNVNCIELKFLGHVFASKDTYLNLKLYPAKNNGTNARKTSQIALPICCNR